MKVTVQLESRDVRMIIAKFLGIPVDDVIPNRYSFSVAGMSAEEIENRLAGEAESHSEV